MHFILVLFSLTAYPQTTATGQAQVYTVGEFRRLKDCNDAGTELIKPVTIVIKNSENRNMTTVIHSQYRCIPKSESIKE